MDPTLTASALREVRKLGCVRMFVGKLVLRGTLGGSKHRTVDTKGCRQQQWTVTSSLSQPWLGYRVVRRVDDVG